MFTKKQIEASNQRTQRLARIILVAAHAAGGTIDRRAVSECLQVAGFHEMTVGELTEAFQLLTHSGRCEVKRGLSGYMSSSDTSVTVK